MFSKANSQRKILRGIRLIESNIGFIAIPCFWFSEKFHSIYESETRFRFSEA